MTCIKFIKNLKQIYDLEKVNKKDQKIRKMYSVIR